MNRTASLALVLLMSCGVAHGKRASKRVAWDAVEALPIDSWVRLRPENQGRPDTCRVVSVDDVALTCIRESRTSEVRLVFPRAAVRDVWTMEPAHERHVVKWVFVGIGVGLGTALIVANPVVGLLIVGVTVAAIVSPDPRYSRYPSYPPYPPYPRSITQPQAPRFHWQLVYQVP